VQRVFESALITDRNSLPDVQLLRIRADFLRVPIESREHTGQRHVVLDADRLEELGVSTSVLRGEQRFDQFALFTLNQLQELTDPLIRPTRARRWRVCTIRLCPASAITAVQPGDRERGFWRVAQDRHAIDQDSKWGIAHDAS